MTYADTITLLVCLFMVLLSASVAKKDHPRVACPVTAPTRSLSADPFGGRLAFPSGGEVEEDDRVPPVMTTRAVLVATAPAPVPVPVKALPPGLAALAARKTAQVEQGGRVTQVQVSSAAFFDVGSAVISDSGKAILGQVAASLSSPQFARDQVTVEGHTDDAPIHSAQFPSNWELSTARASAVVHFFLDAGIAPSRLRAAGYADTFPLAPNRDADGRAIPDNQARNRRVVIKMERVG